MQQHGALPFCQPCKQDAAVSGHPTGGWPSQPGSPPQVPSKLPYLCIFALTAGNRNCGEGPAQQAHVARAMVAHWLVCTYAEECCCCRIDLLRDVHSMPALERSTSLAPNTRRSGTAVCQAMPIAEVAGEFAEISGFATVMFAITLVVSVNRRAIRRAKCVLIPSWRHFAWVLGTITWGPMSLTHHEPRTVLLQGLAAGFVLLRFEALVEEGKLDDVLK